MYKRSRPPSRDVALTLGRPVVLPGWPLSPAEYPHGCIPSWLLVSVSCADLLLSVDDNHT